MGAKLGTEDISKQQIRKFERKVMSKIHSLIKNPEGSWRI